MSGDENDRVPLGPVGIWSPELRMGQAAPTEAAAAALEELGFLAFWLPGRDGIDGLLRASENILRGTTRAAVLLAVMAIWFASPKEAASRHARLQRAYGGRLVFGLGSSSAEVARDLGGRTVFHPVADVTEYLDKLDALDIPIPPEERLLGAMGPKMAQLAARRTRGIHPWLVTPEYSATARALLGPEALIAPYVPVVFSTDLTHVRSTIRDRITPFLSIPAFHSNLLRQGFDESDLASGGSDRLVDAITAWGDPDSIRGTLLRHLRAGADHVAVQVLGHQTDYPEHEWRELAAIAASLDGEVKACR